MPLPDTGVYYLTRQRKYLSYKEKSDFPVSTAYLKQRTSRYKQSEENRNTSAQLLGFFCFLSSLAHQQKKWVWSIKIKTLTSKGRYFIYVFLHDQPYTYIYLHLPIEAIVQQQVVGHSDPVGFHWVSLAIIVVSNITWEQKGFCYSRKNSKFLQGESELSHRSHRVICHFICTSVCRVSQVSPWIQKSLSQIRQTFGNQGMVRKGMF